MNGLQRIHVYFSGLIPQLKRHHNGSKRIRDFENSTGKYFLAGRVIKL